MSGEYDIIVADGFSGNIALKSTEGAVKGLVSILKTNIKSSVKASIGYKLFMQKAFKKTIKVMDYTSHGGAVFLGVNGVVVKNHGSSKAPAFVSSLKQAEKAVNGNINEEIALRLSQDEIKEIKFE